MKLIKAILAGLIIVFLIGLWTKHKCEELQARSIPVSVKQQVINLQRKVSAVPDGIIGYDTMKKVNESVKAEERETFNDFAEKYMTKTGEPK